MEYDFLVFGATGMQGKIVVRDLIESNFNVFLSDLYQQELQEASKNYPDSGYKALNLTDLQAVEDLITKVNPAVVINCAEGDWNLNVYKAALSAGANVIDLGSDIPTTQEQIALDEKFKSKGLTAITGCGSTPGINNIMLNYAIDYFDSIDTVEAGFVWDSNIKKFVVPFSMESIIEEFTEPAFIVDNGEWVKKEPLDLIERRKFRVISKQKCFFVRHPEVLTFYLYHKDKGLNNIRFYAGFPDHSFDEILNYVNGGISESREVYVDGKGRVALGELTKTLQKTNPPPEGYKEKENLWVVIYGKKDGQDKKSLMECVVKTLPGWEDAGCNIDTGFPASIIGQMILNGSIKEKGSFASGPVVPPELFFVELRKKQMEIYKDGQRLA